MQNLSDERKEKVDMITALFDRFPGSKYDPMDFSDAQNFNKFVDETNSKHNSNMQFEEEKT